MKLYSNTLRECDIRHAAASCGEPLSNGAQGGAVHASEISPIGAPRVRSRGWRVQLHSWASNRHHNSGKYGAADKGAASWDDHGRFFAALFDLDPNARLAVYDGREHFHRATEGKYQTTQTKGSTE